ncbi:hypothetical protein [Elizabethkingia sp. JS20170427COW]|uniref:hypothetical protein n=1 Tax=Elizabethkingia sp. JS20170427COW TaxID=2583851 RepID=UPI002108181F|nr:hypothetical protein [Elizabethkingia sp. JS20170427COW]
MMKSIIYLFCMTLTFSACAQSTKENTTKNKNLTKTQKTMDLTKITNPQVKQAIEALQNNDKATWYSYFTKDANFTDDGRTLDFKSFFDNAFSHKERFLEIEKVENGGKDITGKFFAGQWGTFRVFFKFHQQADGKFNRLDIGQARN